MQQFTEAVTWFPVDTEKYRFHLSMRSQGDQEGASRPFPSAVSHRTSVGYAGTAAAASTSLLTPTSGISGLSIASPITASFPEACAPPSLLPQAPQRIPLPRNNSFPPAGPNGRPAPRSSAISSTNNSPPPSAASIASGSDAEVKPGLVKHLQKIHGLTKKRHYGLQTPRAPFLRDETNSSSPYTSTSSVDPANGRPRRNTGVHASKSKKGDDPRRPRLLRPLLGRSLHPQGQSPSGCKWACPYRPPHLTWRSPVTRPWRHRHRLCGRARHSCRPP